MQIDTLRKVAFVFHNVWLSLEGVGVESFCSLAPSTVAEQIRYHWGRGPMWKFGQRLHGLNWVRIPKTLMLRAWILKDE